MNVIMRYSLLLLAVLVVVSIAAPNTIAEKSADKVCTSEGCKRASQRILEYIDTSIDPCENFYKFACNGFIKSTIIPPDKVGVTPYTLIHDVLQHRLKALFEEDYQLKEIKPFSSAKRFYRSCMNTSLIDSIGLTSIIELLKQLGGWPVLDGEKWSGDSFDWKNNTYNLQRLGMFHYSFLTFSVDSHLKNSTLGMLSLEQAQLGVYQEVLSQGLNNTIVQAYYKLMVNLAVICGADREFAEKEMLDALNLEISIAKISTPIEKLRNINLLYNPSTLSELQIKYPEIPWIEFANNLFGTEDQVINGTEIVNVQLPQFISDVVALLKQTPKRIQSNYAIWKAVKSLTPFLTGKILEELLEFEKIRTGVKNRNERWQECIVILSDKLPLIVGAMYVRKHFSPEARHNVKEIVHTIKETFTQVVKDVDWMDNATKRHALLKIKKMHSHIGYSDELLDDKVLEHYYSMLQLNSDNFLQLGLNCSLFRQQKSSERLREIITRLDWRTRSTPAVINAFNSLGDNTIEFPAGILQDVYFDENRPRFNNFGAIGFLIGHEITHGFDDQGRQFDEKGNLVDWWGKETSEAFVKKAQCIIDQYSNYTVPEVGLKLNGINSQGENIADNGGVKEAYTAYQNWVSSHSPEPKLPGLNYTSNQLFWISAANIWCSKYNLEYTRLLVQTNAHCPNEFRVIGSLQNRKEFAKDFGCPLGSPMNPEKKCTVW